MDDDPTVQIEDVVVEDAESIFGTQDHPTDVQRHGREQVRGDRNGELGRLVRISQLHIFLMASV